jgi:hypothetical protein
MVKCDTKMNTFNGKTQWCNQMRHEIKKETTWTLLIKNDTSVMK